MAEMIKCKLNGKFDIVLPKHRAERPEWYTDKGWEKKRLEHMHKHLSKSDTMFYIGVEEGDMTALCALWGAKLVMFEPNELVMPNIKAIWEANNLNLNDTFYPIYKPKKEKSCIKCGTTYFNKNSDSQYCSKDCWYRRKK